MSLSLLNVLIPAVIAALVTVGIELLRRKGAKEVVQSGTAVQMRTLDQTLIDRLQTQIEKDDQRYAALNLRVEGLERELAQEAQSRAVAERSLSAALGYIRRLLDWITEHMPAGPTPPDIPITLREELT